jgi:hypothetical protein
MDNPILFCDSAKGLVGQYLKIVGFPQEELMRSSFPLSYWSLWWGLFYLTGNTDPIVAIVMTLTNCKSQNEGVPSPILEHAVAQLTTNAYQHSLVYSIVAGLKQKNAKCDWLQSVLDDVDQLHQEHGAFKLSTYEHSPPPLMKSSGKPISLEHIPSMQTPLGPILPPTPYVVLKNQLSETVKAAEKRGFKLIDGDYDEDVVIKTLSGLWDKHARREELEEKVLDETITPAHDLIFNTLELMAASRFSNHISTLHALAKLCVLYHNHNRPEAFLNGTGKSHS